jgi:uncharacterized membrane protein YdbT with pleckstrin-like domain
MPGRRNNNEGKTGPTTKTMAYVEEHLLPGERVKHRAHLHKIVFLGPATVSLALLIGAVLAFAQGYNLAGGIVLLAAALPLLSAFIPVATSEFAVTDKRVIIKVGWVQRRTLETMLGKVEGIGVDQTVLGRVLNFGTITVTGTGGTQERFTNIAAPLEFRRQVQAQVSASEEARTAGLVSAFQPSAATPREERDCPYCAERILARAKVCKHCGRDVEPLG